MYTNKILIRTIVYGLVACGFLLNLVCCDDSKLPRKPESSSEEKLDKSHEPLKLDKHEQDVMKSIKPATGPYEPLRTAEHDRDGSGVSIRNLVEVDVGFIHAFVASLSVIIVSELGDKTFFIAAIMAMRHARVTVFAGAILALAVMTILSALLGFATTVIPRWFTYYVSCLLFAVFGIKMLKEAYSMDANEAQEEYEEVQTELRKKDEEMEKQTTTDVESGIVRTPQRRILYSFFSRVFLQAFTLTFLAEWGDRSQIATIILAARDEVVGVIIGGILGHALCTSLAVIGGRCIAQHISIKTVHFVGGVVFIIFALSAFFIHPDDHE